DGAGVYFLSLTVATVATVAGRLGLDNPLLRLTAAGASSGDWATVNAVYRTGMRLAVTASVVSSAAAWVGAGWLARVLFSKPELAAPIRVMSLAVLPMVVVALHGQLLRGVKRIFASQLVSGVVTPAASLLAVYVLAQEFGLIGAIWGSALAAAVAALLGWRMWVTSVQGREVQGVVFDRGALLRSSMPLLWVASMNLIMGWASTLILGIWGTTAEVGVFNAAYRAALVTGVALTSVNSIAAPKFAALYHEADWEALGATARNTTKLLVLLVSPVLVVFMFASHWVMRLFGPEFGSGAATLSVLALGQFVSVATGSVGYLLMMCGQERRLRDAVLVGAGVNLALNLVLVPRLGVLGAAIASAVGMSALNLLAAYYVWTRLRIWSIPFVPALVRATRA
ncbi:MAG: polysaccharide biosynthesis C-terminal domain-containing protein, partial [Gemmatimonadales bacterium]